MLDFSSCRESHFPDQICFNEMSDLQKVWRMFREDFRIIIIIVVVERSIKRTNEKITISKQLFMQKLWIQIPIRSGVCFHASRRRRRRRRRRRIVMAWITKKFEPDKSYKF